MNVRILFILALICSVNIWGQKTPNKAGIDAQEIIIKKQIIVDDLENQIKDVPLAAVRVFVRYQLASWLWKDGSDKTGRAEPMAVQAIDELFEKKTEIPSTYFNSLKSDFFALLERNAKEIANKLKAKYNLNGDDSLDSAALYLDKKDGERLAAEKIIKSLNEQPDLSPSVIALIGRLQSRKSVELPNILATILYLEETGKSNFSADSLGFLIEEFRDSIVPNALRIRFFKIVLKKAQNAIQFPGENVESDYYLINFVVPDIAANAPDLSSEAAVLQAVLSSRVSQSTREERERFERIEQSSDKIGAMIAEAEKTDNKIVKYHLYSSAALLALKKEKFQLAVDITEKTMDGNSINSIPDTFRKLWHDQTLGEVARYALKKKDTDAAQYATKRIIDELTRAEVLRKTATYYFEKQDLISASDSFDEAFKLTNKADNNAIKVRSLLHLLLTIQKIDRSHIAEVAKTTAKAISDIPTPGIDDKPGTENYEKYVVSVMVTNWNLLPVMVELSKESRNEALDFANRISGREIRIVANAALLIKGHD